MEGLGLLQTLFFHGSAVRIPGSFRGAAGSGVSSGAAGEAESGFG